MKVCGKRPSIDYQTAKEREAKGRLLMLANVYYGFYDPLFLSQNVS